MVCVPAIAGLWAGPAAAQQQQSSQAGQLEEIIVTAEKRESTIETTAISLTAVSGADILNRGFTDLALRSLQAQAREAVGRHRRQRPAVAVAFRIDKCSPIGRETRRFVQPPVRQHAHRPAGEILHGNPVGAVVERYHRQLRAIRAQAISFPPIG